MGDRSSLRLMFFFHLLEGLKITDFDEQKNWALLLKKAFGVLGVKKRGLVSDSVKPRPQNSEIVK